MPASPARGYPLQSRGARSSVTCSSRAGRGPGAGRARAGRRPGAGRAQAGRKPGAGRAQAGRRLVAQAGRRSAQVRRRSGAGQAQVRRRSGAGKAQGFTCIRGVPAAYSSRAPRVAVAMCSSGACGVLLPCRSRARGDVLVGCLRGGSPRTGRERPCNVFVATRGGPPCARRDLWRPAVCPPGPVAARRVAAGDLWPPVAWPPGTCGRPSRGHRVLGCCGALVVLLRPFGAGWLASLCGRVWRCAGR